MKKRKATRPTVQTTRNVIRKNSRNKFDSDRKQHRDSLLRKARAEEKKAMIR